MNKLNNEDAIGYNNLEERAADIENNRDIAHDNAFDKLLAEHFLHSRQDIKKGNDLHLELENNF